MRCTGEKCPLRGELLDLLGEIEACTNHDCPNRTQPPPGTDDNRDHSGLLEE